MVEDVPEEAQKQPVDHAPGAGPAVAAALPVPSPVVHAEGLTQNEQPRADDLPAQTEKLHISEPTPVSAVKETAPLLKEPTPAVSAPVPKVSEEPTEKPSSFKDKLAAFNRSAGSAGPPPPLKPKPLGAGAGGVGTWAWKQKQQQQQQATSHSKPTEPDHPTPSHETDPPPANAAGMSASDAKASIGLGGSLKERMAALAGAGAFGAPAGEKAGKGPPPVIGSKPRVWKRPEVVAPAPVEAGETAEGHSAAGEESTERGEGEEGEREDQLDKERRAAIAARMARLGGRGVMGMPMGMAGAKPSPIVADHAEETAGEVTCGEKLDEGASPIEKAPAPSGDAADSQPGTIAMPAIPRKAGPPRRKPPTRTATGGSAASTPAIESSQSLPSLDTQSSVAPTAAQITSPTTEGDDREIPLPKTSEQILQNREFEQAGAGSHGVEGAQAAGIALAPSNAQSEQARDLPPDAPAEDDDDREIPLLRTAEEIAQEHEYEEAGKGLHGAEGAKAAGIALADVGGEGEQAKEVPPSPAARGLGVHHERSLPPPPPPADDDDDFSGPGEEEDEDEDAGDDIMKQAASGGLLVTPASHEEPSLDEAPVGFQPLQSAAPITPMTKPSTGVSSGATPHDMLGLPKDEVALKHEAEATKEDDDEDAPPPPPRAAAAGDETERIKPAGPRPLPPSPGCALPQLQTVQPMAGESVSSPVATREDVESNQEETAPPPPRRQASVRSPVQTSGPVLGEPQTSIQGKSCLTRS